MFNWFKKFTPFQKWFFCVFLVGAIVSLFLPLATGASWATVFEFTAVLGILSTISGILNSIYVCRAEIILYFWWGANTVFFGIQCIPEHLYSTFFLNIVIVLPIIVWGYYKWRRDIKKAQEIGEMKEDDTVQIRKFNAKQWVLAAVIFIVAWAAYCVFAIYFPDIVALFGIKIPMDANFILDSLIAVGTAYAVILTGTRNVENWYFWFIVNIVGIGLFLDQLIKSIVAGNMSIMQLGGVIMYVQYLVSNIYGYWCWLNLRKKQKGKGKQGDKQVAA
ncbi:MAG: nicotinamide riboside transporter PnuC [Sarcina sp.]